MKPLLIALIGLAIASPVWACGSYEECFSYAKTGLSCHSWVRNASPRVYTYSSKCPDNSGGINDPIGCTCVELTKEMKDNYRTEAIAYKLDEISKKMDKQ